VQDAALVHPGAHAQVPELDAALWGQLAQVHAPPHVHEAALVQPGLQEQVSPLVLVLWGQLAHEQLGPHTHVAAVRQPVAHEQDGALVEHEHAEPQLQAPPVAGLQQDAVGAVPQHDGAATEVDALWGHLAHVHVPPHVQDAASVQPGLQEHVSPLVLVLWGQHAHEQLGPHTHVAAVTQPAAHEQEAALEEQAHAEPQLQAPPVAGLQHEAVDAVPQHDGAATEVEGLWGHLAHVHVPPHVQDAALTQSALQEQASALVLVL